MPTASSPSSRRIDSNKLAEQSNDHRRESHEQLSACSAASAVNRERTSRFSTFQSKADLDALTVTNRYAARLRKVAIRCTLHRVASCGRRRERERTPLVAQRGDVGESDRALGQPD